MVTRKIEEKFEKLKCYFNAKMSEQEENLMKVFNVLNDLREEITNNFKMKLKVTASTWNLKTKC